MRQRSGCGRFTPAASAISRGGPGMHAGGEFVSLASRRDDLTIGRISALSGVKIETIRYYERIGLLARPSRTPGGRRLYGADDVRALGFIRRSRELGFSLDDIRSLLRLASTKATCRQFRDIAEVRLEEIRARLFDLGKMERVLDLAIARCTGDDAPECAILDVLDDRAA